MANNKISYSERDFVGLRNELLNYTQEQYPDLIQNANDASLFSVFLDLNAAIADNLHYHIDRSLQETVLQYANQRSSLSPPPEACKTGTVIKNTRNKTLCFCL